MKRPRLGVIGVGYIGELHVRKYIALKDIDFIGIVDLDSSRAQDVAAKYNTRVYRDYREILPHVDGISLTVPTDSHFKLGYDILNHGIHLLIEKPIAASLHEADRLIELAKKKSAVLQVGHIERFNPAVVQMESLVSAPCFIEARRIGPFSKRGTDVDVVLDLMIHDLDIILSLVHSEIKKIDAVGMPVITSKVDFANARLVFKNGVVASLTSSRISKEPSRTIELYQNNSCVSVDYARKKISITNINGTGKNSHVFTIPVYREDEFSDGDPMADQIRSFVKSIRDGIEPKVSGADGRNALALALSIIDLIYEQKRD